MSATDDDVSHLQKSRRNRTHLATYDPKSTAFVGQLIAQIEGERTRAFTNVERRERQRNMTCLILDLLSASEAGEDVWIGYNRGKQKFVRGGAYWDEGQDRPAISYSHYLASVDYLEGRGFVESRTAPQGYSNYSSRIRATQKLRDCFREAGMDWTCILTADDAQSIIVKDENKNPTSWPDPGHFNLDEALTKLRIINSNLSNTFINLNISDADFASLEKSATGSPDDEPEDKQRGALDFSQRFLRRIFGNNSFGVGGRFYGGWWQSIPSRFRKYIEIDGAMTVELDFSTLQPRILYASVGMAPPNDSYTLGGWIDKEYGFELRKVIKKLFSQLLNSDPTSENPKQWHRFAPYLDPNPLPPGWSEWGQHERNAARRKVFYERTGREFSELIQALLDFHEPIRADFFSGVWGATQNLDSQIVEKVLIRLLNDEHGPITALPIHDSFIVRRGAEPKLHDAMVDAFNEVVGAAAKIDRDETVFDPPEGYDPDAQPRLVNSKDTMESTKEWILSHTGYHKREHQWVNRHGPL